MKKLNIIALLLVSAFVGGVAYAGVTDPTVPGIKKRTVGDNQGEPVRVFKLVRNPDRRDIATTIVSGEVLIYDTLSDDAVTIARTTSSHDNRVAGIAVTAILTSDSTQTSNAVDDEGRRNWGWIIVHGPAFAQVTAGAGSGIVANAPWITSTDSGSVGYITDGSTSAVHYQGIGGFFFDTGAAGDTQAEVFVRLE